MAKKAKTTRPYSDAADGFFFCRGSRYGGGRQQRRYIMSEARFDPVELRRRIDHWMENGGAQELAAAVQRAAETRAEIRESLRIDHETLHRPMTI